MSYPNWIPLEINLGRVRVDIDTCAVDRCRRRPKRLLVAAPKVLLAIWTENVRRRRDFVLPVEIKIDDLVQIVAQVDHSSLIAECEAAEDLDVYSVNSFSRDRFIS